MGGVVWCGWCGVGGCVVWCGWVCGVGGVGGVVWVVWFGWCGVVWVVWVGVWCGVVGVRGVVWCGIGNEKSSTTGPTPPTGTFSIGFTTTSRDCRVICIRLCVRM